VVDGSVVVSVGKPQVEGGSDVGGSGGSARCHWPTALDGHDASRTVSVADESAFGRANRDG